MVEAILRHVALPAAAPAAVIGLYFTPVLLFGCVNRGLLAVAVVLVSAGAAFVTARIGLREQARGRSSGQVADLDRDPHDPAGPGAGPARLTRAAERRCPF